VGDGVRDHALFRLGICDGSDRHAVPKLKGLFALSYTEVMLTQFSFFLAYLFVSLPAGFLLMRIGYVRGIVTGLLIMAAGCLLFAPAAAIGVFPGFLVALFTMAVGITILQVAANPLVALLGSEETSHSRLNLAQAFNSLGTTLGPLVGSALILATGVVLPDVRKIGPLALATLRRTEAHALQVPFLGIAAGLLALAAVFWILRKSIVVPRADKAANLSSTLALLRNPRLGLGAVSIFIYVGAEVSIGSMMTNYLMLPHTLGLVAARAGQIVSLYWGGAMIGRFIGSAVLRYVPAGTALLVCAAIAMSLVLTSSASAGTLAAITIVAVGLFNSIMFPTIFTLAIEGEGGDTPQASGLLCMAIVGGAIIPVIVGAVADRFGLSIALIVPALCYVWIACYGWMGRRPVKPSGAAADQTVGMVPPSRT
jgi:FHS family L-fucose permease-like MFS transporter